MSKLVLKGRLFTGTELFEDGVVVVDQDSGVIEDAGRQSDVDEPKETEVFAGENSTILPGFMDVHMHFFGSKHYDLMEWVATPETLVALRSVADMRRLLYAGFTTVRDLGSKSAVYLSRAEKEGVIEGPRVIAASKSLAQTGGDDDPTILPLKIAQELSYSYYCDDPWECRKAVRMVLRDGGEVIKVYASGSFAQGGKPRVQLTVEELKAIVDEAHRAGIRVTAHAYGEQALINTIEAGVDSIEHGIALTPEIAESIKKKGIYYVPTLSAFLAAKPSGNAERDRLIKRHLSSDMQLAKEYGLKVVCGSDFVGADNEPHGNNYKEIVNLATYFGIKEALTAATSRAAECLDLQSVGRLAKGYQADIVVTKGNPFEDPQLLSPQSIVMVLKEGKKYVDE
jgi:imidazolonepropionase-like amidohydrolase